MQNSTVGGQEIFVSLFPTFLHTLGLLVSLHALKTHREERV